MQHSLIDERSLAMDRVVIRRLRENPALVKVAKANLGRWLATCSPGVKPDLLKWQARLDGDFEALLQFMGSDSPEATRLRQSSPFAGSNFISNKERSQILKEYRELDHHAVTAHDRSKASS